MLITHAHVYSCPADRRLVCPWEGKYFCPVGGCHGARYVCCCTTFAGPSSQHLCHERLMGMQKYTKHVQVFQSIRMPYIVCDAPTALCILLYIICILAAAMGCSRPAAMLLCGCMFLVPVSFQSRSSLVSVCICLGSGILLMCCAVYQLLQASGVRCALFFLHRRSILDSESWAKSDDLYRHTLAFRGGKAC